MLKAEAQVADRQSRPTLKWRIAHKLTLASILMLLLAMAAGGVGLWQVFAIGQAMDDAREKEQQLAESLELLAAGHRLVAAMNQMVLTEEPLLASTEIAVSLGTLSFHVETLQESGEEAGTLGLIGEVQVAYDELRETVNETGLLARQEFWPEARLALEQEVRPANERMGQAIRQLVRQANQDAQAATLRSQLVVRQATLQLAILLLLTTAIALGWRQFVFRGLSLSIDELRQGVARISSGDLEYDLSIRTGDEIEELGDEFNKMADELADLIGSLEQRVADRTADLERRAQQLEASARVARDTTLVLEPQQLIERVVSLISERFGFYHASIFLLDENKEWAILQAASSEGGQRMLARGYRLKVGEVGIVGHVTSRGEPRVTLDVGEDAVFFDNPDLHRTRSEMALPLRARGEIIGALDVQSTEAQAFSNEDVEVLQTLADQVAVAIDNARLFAESQAALEERDATHRRYLLQEWAAYLPTAKTMSYQAGRPDAAPPSAELLSEIQQAMKQPRVMALTGNGAQGAALVAPIAVRGAVIGALGIQDDEGARQWTDDDVALFQAVAERLALAAENLRLLDETQRRAAREQLVGEATARIRETLDIETVLQTVVYEIGETLGLHDVAIRLQVETDQTN